MFTLQNVRSASAAGQQLSSVLPKSPNIQPLLFIKPLLVAK